jgi:hypothetical protein
MTRVETQAVVGEDRTVTVTLRVPEDVAPGEHRLIVLVDGPVDAEAPAPPEPTPRECFKREGSVLVFTGKLEEDPEEVLRRLRREREDRLLYGPFE